MHRSKSSKTKSSPKSGKTLEGHVDGVVGRGLSGWVLRPASPEERLWVELRVDGCCLGIARAENFHPGAQSFGDGCYGFWIPLPPMAVEQPMEAVVCVANTGETFAPPHPLNPAESDRVELSRVFHDGGLRLTGWAVDAKQPRRNVRVSARLDGRELAATPASRRRFDPMHSDGHGFDFSLPLDLADGREYFVDVLDDENNPLPGSPVWVRIVLDGAAGMLGNADITGEEKELLLQIVDRYEKWQSKSVHFAWYPRWKEAFPPPLPAAVSSRVAVCPHGVGVEDLLNAARDSAAVMLMTEGARLLPDALKHLSVAARSSGAVLVYGDEEVTLPEGPNPLFKPAWDPYLFYGQDYLGPVLINSRVVEEARLDSDLSPIALRTRLILAAARKGVCHVPLLLSSGMQEVASGDEAVERRRALQSHALPGHEGIQVREHPHLPHLNRLSFRIEGAPTVSIIIPTRDRADLLSRCLDSLWQVSSYPHVEILIIDNGSIEPESLRLLRGAKRKGARILPYPHPFNYSAMNNMAAHRASGEVLCFLNNDTEVLTPDWIEEMLALLQLPQVGCVGARLLWPNNLVQHGGVVVGAYQLAAHVGNWWTADVPGYMNRNQLTQQWSAVTAACMLTPKALFLDSGAFDPVHFPVSFNDVDYCLRLREQGKKILWTPWAHLAHHESASRGKDATPPQKARAAMEMHHFRTRWGHYEDPFYNPNLTLGTVAEPFEGLALPPRQRKIRL